MKNRIILSILVTVFSITCSFSALQEKYTKHVVLKGETIIQIAQKYKVTPYDIYRLNPDSQNGIAPNSVLLIPPTTNSASTNLQLKMVTPTTEITHEVKPKETLFSLSIQYDVTVASIENANAELLKKGLKIGQLIKIPSKNSTQNETVSPPTFAPKAVVKDTAKESPNVVPIKGKAIYHVIEPKETKYAIAKKYGITIEELERQNPQIVSSFPIGFKLLISGKATQNETTVVEKQEVEKTVGVKSEKKYLQEYLVKPKETLYSISAQFGISETELLALNPELKNGVKLGMLIRVPLLSKPIVVKKVDGDLAKSLKSQEKKELVMLLPFNITKIESDTVNSTQARLKKDKFLNMTLDFYSGALMAIDSAKVLGLNIDVKIFDSQETKNSSNVYSIASENKLAESDAVIGPFYQSNVEKLAELLEKNNTPVISPLSKEVGKKYNNLYQSMPSADYMKTAMFDYMKAKNGNVLALIDPKKGSVKQYIQEFQSEVKIVGLSEKGRVDADSLRSLLIKDKINFVILASESTGMILATTNAMIAAMKDYQVQLVILEENETLDFEEISLSRLTKLKMIYPSLTRPNETLESSYFDNNYKKLNKVLPSQYAIRGFDVTFDTLLRLSQEKTFEETAQTIASQQIENKFNYIQKPSEGYTNKGVYILYYDADLTIKEAQ
jgi:LysM repeat protein/ABC-type branched-subunit amino acid transport system substrate-binding protein